jgi:hypothetical protein
MLPGVNRVQSREMQAKELFAQIAGIPDPNSGVAVTGTGLAEPGDLLFFVTHHPDLVSLESARPNTRTSRLARLLHPFFRRSYGYDQHDFDDWHVAIFLMGRKHKNHTRMNLWMVHSLNDSLKSKGGVNIQHLSPNVFRENPGAPQKRMEILRFKGISNEQRKTITEFASALVGSKYDSSILMGAKLSLVLGLPNVLHDPGSFACQSLVVAAYSAAGIGFPHPYRSFPRWNIGRLLGRPLGHAQDRVNPRYPYLMDHHIYRDPRFEVRAVVLQDAHSHQFQLATAHLDKYSWNLSLRDKYIGVGADQ